MRTHTHTQLAFLPPISGLRRSSARTSLASADGTRTTRRRRLRMARARWPAAAWSGRLLLVAAALLLLLFAVASCAAVVLSPANGASNVDPEITSVTITFDTNVSIGVGS